MRKTVKMWSSKYALTQGVEEVEVEISGTYAYYHGIKYGSQQYKIGRDIWETREAAIKAAESMKRKKLDSLRKQFDKLQKLIFS